MKGCASISRILYPVTHTVSDGIAIIYLVRHLRAGSSDLPVLRFFDEERNTDSIPPVVPVRKTYMVLLRIGFVDPRYL